MDNSISAEKRQQLRLKFKNNKKAIQALLKQFHYQQKISHFDNMRKLCTCLENVMNIESFYDFSKYLSDENHLPIQINFKALKYQKIYQIFQDWLITKDQYSLGNIQRFPTRKHRNIIFKRIFLEQKQTICDYFTVLSQKKKLKGFDLFQLLTQILGPYYLYQYNSDTVTYFEKINTFQSFTKVVQSYVRSNSRIYKKDLSQPGDQNYIRLYEFQSLIQFWQNLNPQLTLQQQARKNLNNIFVQTTPLNLVTRQTQTQREYSKNYLNVINSSLRQINLLIESQNDPDLLASLDRIFEVLKSQKIFAVSHPQKVQKKNTNKGNRFLISSEYSEAQPLIIKPVSPTNRNRNLSPQKLLNNNNHLLSPEKEQDDSKTIYKYLCSLDNLYCLTLTGLQSFFNLVGLTHENQNFLINNLVSYGYVEDKDDINLKQFKTIIRQLMKQNKKFNNNTLKNFITSNIQQNHLRKTAYFKSSNDSYRGNILNQSLLNRNNRQQSRTTYPMDSDGSNL